MHWQSGSSCSANQRVGHNNLAVHQFEIKNIATELQERYSYTAPACISSAAVLILHPFFFLSHHRVVSSVFRQRDDWNIKRRWCRLLTSDLYTGEISTSRPILLSSFIRRRPGGSHRLMYCTRRVVRNWNGCDIACIDMRYLRYIY